MRVLCAWCLKEGKPDSEALIGEKEPPHGVDSHGICPAQRKDVEDRVTALRLEAERQREAAERLRQQVDP